jgi:hypothetical protein
MSKPGEMPIDILRRLCHRLRQLSLADEIPSLFVRYAVRQVFSQLGVRQSRGGSSMRIDVSLVDMWYGTRQKTQECMIAVAIKRTTGLSAVSVGYTQVRIGTVDIELDKRTIAKIRAYDRRGFVISFSFDLILSVEKPEPTLAKIAA